MTTKKKTREMTAEYFFLLNGISFVNRKKEEKKRKKRK